MKKLEELGIGNTKWDANGNAVYDGNGYCVLDSHNALSDREARFIASAPALYEAARQAYELLSNIIEGDQSEGLVSNGCKVRETLRKALEEAGGAE